MSRPSDSASAKRSAGQSGWFSGGSCWGGVVVQPVRSDNRLPGRRRLKIEANQAKLIRRWFRAFLIVCLVIVEFVPSHDGHPLRVPGQNTQSPIRE